jgi:O-antigen/teichoic acid export membrane protein
MSLKHNIVFNFVSQVYVTVLSIVMLPLYLKYLGSEAFGLVAFSAAIQAWFQIMDVGLTPTLGRETARFQGGGCTGESLRSLLRSMEVIFIGTALAAGLAINLSSSWIASTWLNAQALPLQEVENSITLMGLVLALRWLSGPYRGAINGFERITWLCTFNAIAATFRFVIILPVFIFIGKSPTYFFAFQVCVAAVELLVLITKTYQLVPALNGPTKYRWGLNWVPLREVAKFSSGIAYASGAWVLLTQTDKLILSKLLTLTDYAYFSLAAQVASGLLVLTTAISSTVVPRLSRLDAEGKQEELIRTYRQVTQMVTAIATSVALILSVFDEQILLVLTGDATIAKSSAKILSLYAFGNGIYAIGTLQTYLQFAKGDLKLHVTGNTLLVLFVVPALIASSINFGAEGAGYCWLTATIIYFVFWVPRVHSRLYPNLNKVWHFRDVFVVSIFSFGGISIAKQISNIEGFLTNDRFALALSIAFLGLLTFATSSLGTAWMINFLKTQLGLHRRA